MSWVRDLTLEEQRGLTFAFAYERARASRQRGFKLWRKFSKESLDTPKFRTARTLSKWFQEKWSVTRKEVNLDGYVEYVFDRLSPTIPHLGQLKNERLIREFISSCPNPKKVRLNIKSESEMRDLYRSILSEEFSSSKGLQSLGLLGDM